MKAILVIDVQMTEDGKHICDSCPVWDEKGCMCKYDFMFGNKGCPLKPIHALKIANKDYIIYERQYLYENLEREYELMKGAREYDRK